MTPSESPEAAKKYFDTGLSREDYYCGKNAETKEPGEPSHWGGKGAERLGLSGEVKREAFHNLCANQTPDGSGRLTPRTKAKRRVGYDITYLVSKSVAILFALTGDRKILECFRLAVVLTMQLIEASMETRVRQGGANANRITGNLIWAMFIHLTTRPVNGIPDPLLHAHVYAFNATRDDVEKRWKAGEFGRIKAMASFYEAVFHSIFASLLVQNGYRVRREGRFFELEGVSRETIEKYSRRTAEIERVAAKQGITDPKKKAGLGAKTRRSKSETRSWPEIQADWKARLTPHEWASLASAKNGDQTRNPNAAREAIDAAIEKCFAKASTVKEHRFLEEALRHGVGQVTLDELRAEMANADIIRREVGGESYITTKTAQTQEQRIVAFARDGRGTCPPLNRGLVGFDATNLSTAQQSASMHVFNSPDRVTLIRSGEGTSREALRRATVGGLEAAGHAVETLTADSRESASAKATKTVAAYLESPGTPNPKSAVLWIEDASRLTPSTLARLFNAAQHNKARLILSGDLTRKSGKRVDVLSTLEQKAGLRSAEVQEYRRTRAEQRTAIEAFRGGQTRDGFQRLDALGGVRETKRGELPNAVAAEYAKATRQGKSAWVVADFDARAFTDAIRFALRRMLGLSRPFYRLDAVKRKDPSDPSCYERGQIVIFYKRTKGFKPGRRYKVIGHDAYGNVLARKGAWVEALPLTKTKNFGLYRESRIELARGDRIRITSGGRTKNETFGREKLLSKRGRGVRIANYKMFGIRIPDRRYRVPRDTSHRITGFTLTGNLKLANGWILDKKFGHIDYAYCSTSTDPPPRGRSIKQLIIVQSGEKPDAELPTRCLGPRGPKVESVTVFTDSRERLRAAMEQANRPNGHGPNNGRPTPTFDREPSGRPRTRQEPDRER